MDLALNALVNAAINIVRHGDVDVWNHTYKWIRG